MMDFESVVASIQDAYETLGHTCGWRFLTSSRSTLSPKTRIALLTLNPGGSCDRPDHGRDSCENGSAYLTKEWKRGHPPGEAPLQVQIRRLFDMLASAIGDERGGDALLNESLTAQIVPFRSPSWESLPRRTESLEFSRKLWDSIFEEISPRLIIAIDQQTTRELAHVMQAKHSGEVSRRRYSVGWDNVSAELIRIGDGSNGCHILRLPHLSQFRVFGREASKSRLSSVIVKAVEDLP